MLEESIKKELERVQGKTKAKRPVKHIPGLVQNPEPTVLKKVTNALIEEDLKTASTSVLDDILIPTVKNLMADMFVGVIERVFRGNSRKPATGGGYYTNYSNSLVRTHTASGTNYSNVTTIRQQQPQEQPVREKLTYSNIVVAVPFLRARRAEPHQRVGGRLQGAGDALHAAERRLARLPGVGGLPDSDLCARDLGAVAANR